MVIRTFRILLAVAGLTGVVAPACADGFYLSAGFGIARTHLSDVGVNFTGGDTSSRWVVGYDRHPGWLPQGWTLGVEAGF